MTRMTVEHPRIEELATQFFFRRQRILATQETIVFRIEGRKLWRFFERDNTLDDRPKNRFCIVEYFIAKKAIEEPEFARNVDFTGMDIARQFYHEMVIPENFVLIKGGTFQMGSEDEDALDREKPAHPVTLSDY
ncbi:MAG: hypothetical protein VX236_04190, partial [Pseudomonadota bacterium]|nr:hypothetical protein [Pseudomonadota bacterium]